MGGKNGGEEGDGEGIVEDDADGGDAKNNLSGASDECRPPHP
jgi:hypothetical protein